MKVILLLVPSLQLFSQTPDTSFTNGFPDNKPISVHDPVMIKQEDTYYIFSTGFGITVWASKNLREWIKQSPVFNKAPAWAADTIPGFRNHIWAPDISFHNGQYYLYYSVSAFGKNTSAIGVATNKTLDKNSSEFRWIDHGRVIQSYPGKTNWNAIDPNLALNESGSPYLVFGSFWDGLKMIKLSGNLLSLAEPGEPISTIASRRKDSSTGANPIEAPFIFKKNSYYYLFASIDYCCQGEKSTYKIIVGRSKNITGPYSDKDGTDLRKGGGTIVMRGDKEWYGAGHNGICTADGKDYIVYHGYDAADKGRSKLIIKVLEWEPNGWPVILPL